MNILRHVWPFSALHAARELCNLQAKTIEVRDGHVRFLRRQLDCMIRHTENLERTLKKPLLEELQRRMGAEIARAGTDAVFKCLMESAANDNTDGHYFTAHIPKSALMVADEKSLLSTVLRAWESHGKNHAEVNIFALPEGLTEQTRTCIEVKVPQLAYRQQVWG